MGNTSCRAKLGSNCRQSTEREPTTEEVIRAANHADDI